MQGTKKNCSSCLCLRKDKAVVTSSRARMSSTAVVTFLSWVCEILEAAL